jgi:hypothetical protein
VFVDVSEATVENYKTHRGRLVTVLGASDPLTLSWQDIQAAVTAPRLTYPPLPCACT